MKTDQQNEGQAEPIGTALALLARDENVFLKTYFLVTPDMKSLGPFTLTSR